MERNSLPEKKQRRNFQFKFKEISTGWNFQLNSCLMKSAPVLRPVRASSIGSKVVAPTKRCSHKSLDDFKTQPEKSGIRTNSFFCSSAPTIPTLRRRRRRRRRCRFRVPCPKKTLLQSFGVFCCSEIFCSVTEFVSGLKSGPTISRIQSNKLARSITKSRKFKRYLKEHS